ncbi:MAG: tRNA (adenosine(37)-N6)-threonylcarbamoyltransferase complex ATPase subunit type 1 TsaE [Pseudohongiellaceae bacterium]
MADKPTFNDHASSETQQLFLADEEQTLSFGSRLAGAILASEEGAIIYLRGDLGAGKTTLARGLVQGFGHDGSVKSPTYTLVEPYELGKVNVYHFDLYRLSDPEEVDFLGVEEYFADANVCLFEWPQKGAGKIPQPDLSLQLSDSGTGRVVECQTHTVKGSKIGQRLWL